MTDNRLITQEWLRQKLAEAGRGSKKKLAMHLGFDRPDAITRMLNTDPTKEFREIKANEFAAMKEFFGETDISSSRIRVISVNSYVQAGGWSETWEWLDEKRYDIAIPNDGEFKNKKLYAAETRGPSMNKRWPEKTVVIFSNIQETEESPIPGKRYVVERMRTNGDREHTVKLLHRDDDGQFWLLPESNDPLHQQAISMKEGNGEGDKVQLIGRVVFAVTRE